MPKGASLLHDDNQISIIDAAPVVFVQRRAHLSEVYQVMFYSLSRSGGMEELRSRVISSGGSQTTASLDLQTIVPAIAISSAITRCEMPTLYNHGDNVVNGALTMCLSDPMHENKLQVMQDSAVLFIGEELIPSVVSPSRVRHMAEQWSPYP